MQGGYGYDGRRRGYERERMIVRGGGRYGGAWGTPPMYDDAPPAMYITQYIRGPPTCPPHQYRGGGGHGGLYGGGRYEGGGRYGGGGYGEGYDEEDGYGGRGQMFRPSQNPEFTGFEIGSNNRTDKGSNQVRLRFDLSKLKDIPERAGGVRIGSGQYARENGNIIVDFSEYQDQAPAPPPQQQ